MLSSALQVLIEVDSVAAAEQLRLMYSGAPFWHGAHDTALVVHLAYAVSEGIGRDRDQVSQPHVNNLFDIPCPSQLKTSLCCMRSSVVPCMHTLTLGLSCRHAHTACCAWTSLYKISSCRR